MWPREAPDIVPARAGAAKNLGSDHDVFACDAHVADGLRQSLFGFSVGINIRGIDEVHTFIEGVFEYFVGKILLNTRDGLPHALAGGEGHGAQANLRDKKAGSAERVVFHENLCAFF